MNGSIYFLACILLSGLGIVMPRVIISTAKAPGAIGPYSQAVKAGNTLYISGQIGLDPNSMEVVGGGVEGQARQVLKNFGEILRAGGSTFEQVLKTTVLLKSMDDFGAVNKIYSEFFSKDPPARAAYEVARLPKDVLVEIEGIALVES
uniref:Ribonuclease UK114 n=1 Tax=Caligus rogercresseyi TaxID=217165 RepID=C1BQE7_CALRO|nr:Ribonuclease UK114 [Caligus rogercresseyi]